MMSDFRARAMQEHGDLNKKIEKLSDFILSEQYDSLPEIERKALKEQLSHMKAYFDVLSKRCSRMCG